ncbi:acyltransferase family protein [Pantoea trifolii]|uniref:acyltransferase family protein n=1 Tax=Candidatus Pantoea symbiotica TaxID=1884370 RepID=UPI002413AD98|nr:acyltransferase [Pantoea rodasii]
MKLAQLTSLRFFAAIGVFMTHYNQHFLSSSNNVLQVLRPIFSESYVWVCFFFVLSGFIISYSQDRNGGDNVKRYITKRIARLFPVYLSTMLFVWYYFPATPDTFKTIANLFLIQSWIPNPSYFWAFNAVAWSISVELFFYFSFLIVKKLSDVEVALLFIGLIALNLFSHLYSFDSRDEVIWFYYINPINRLPDFLAGVLLFRAYKRGLLEKVPLIRNHMEATSIAILLLSIGVAVTTNFTKSYRYDVYYILPCSLVIASFINGGGRVSGFISNRFFVSLGESSFCLYMTHQFFIAIIFSYTSYFSKLDDLNRFLILCPVMLVASIALAQIIHFLIEKPAFNALVNYKKT